MKTSVKIINYLKEKGRVTGNELADYLHITTRGVRKQLRNLLEQKRIAKSGKPPKVFYFIPNREITDEKSQTDTATTKFINEHYLYISPSGEMLQGWSGFVAWCRKTKQEPMKTSREYVATLKKYLALQKNNLLDGMPKMQRTFPKVFVDQLFYIDFYSIERFGKTKLGQLLLYAKQSQSKSLIHKLVQQIRPQIVRITKKMKIDGVLFVPPTVKREIQLMKELERGLHLPLRTLRVAKIKTPISVPQKTLSKIEDRIENARQTIVVEDKNVYNNILLIDDAVGSGATINETAKQIREKGICRKKIIGLAITGSFKGFDVISEV